MRYEHCGLAVLAVALAVGMWTGTDAGEGCCAECGANRQCRRTCRLVCEEKKVEIVCYGCKQDHFCVPRPSCLGCEHCETVCADCDPKVCSKPRKFLWREWQPGKATVYTKRKLMKKVETKKIPSWKWVIEDLCEDCQVKCAAVDVPKGADIPDPPRVAGVRVLGPRQKAVIFAGHVEDERHDR